MSYQPFYIADIKSGLVRNPEAFLIPEDAFPTLENAYIWRGRIRRKEGYEFLGRLQRQISAVTLLDTTATGASTTIADVLNDTAIDVRAPAAPAISETNAAITPGTVTIIVDPGGASQTTFVEPAPPDGTLTLSAGPLTISSATINYTSGQIIFNWAPAIGGPFNIQVTFFYAPALPCMGLRNRELGSINLEDLIGFDRKYAYRYDTVNNRFITFAALVTWMSSDSDFFWTTNFWQDASNNNLFWATNFNAGGGAGTNDPLRFTNGTTWTNFLPAIDGAGNELHQAKILLPFKDRLLAFNTYEGATLDTSISYPQRVRFSQNGDPSDQVNGWRSDISGRGGFIDAPTNEHIVSAQFIRDILVVGFERSTWQLRHTGNNTIPFIWEKINTELGTESAFSMVDFDQGIISTGRDSLHVCDGNSVTRIDLQIPDQVVSFSNTNAGVDRIQGIRDLNIQNVYWTYSSDEDRTFPDKLLVYNYLNGSYAVWNDHFTALGKWYNDQIYRWQDLTIPWESLGKPWNWTLRQLNTPYIVGGNQQGFVEVFNKQTFNDISLQITAISTPTLVRITSPNHNLVSRQFVRLRNILPDPAGGGDIESLNDRLFRITVVDANNFDLFEFDSTAPLPVFLAVTFTSGTYIGNGSIEVCNNFKITSKRFNILETGMKSMLGYIDFLAETTTNGEFTCQIFLDENTSEPVNTASFEVGTDDTNFFNSTVPTNQPQFAHANNNKNWQRFYCNTDGQTYQYQLVLSEVEMSDEDIYQASLVIHALILWQKDGGRLVP